MILVLNCVFTNMKNWGIRSCTSNLDLRRYTHVARVQSSTTVKKYLCPSIVNTENGPQISQYIKSKANFDKWELLRKCNFFCLAYWHIVQGILGSLIPYTYLLKKFIQEMEGWPSLLNQSSNKVHLEVFKHIKLFNKIEKFYM